VLYLVLRHDVGEALTADARRELYVKLNDLRLRRFDQPSVRVAKSLSGGIAIARGRLRVNVEPAWLELSKRWKAFEAAMEGVVRDESIRGGEPIIRGTRFPVYLIVELIEQGADAREILEDYPALTAAKVRVAQAYAQSHPKRGRPRRASR
jgi:uncharacterized protein (DUF433 family)